jgi:hypothetical protein
MILMFTVSPSTLALNTFRRILSSRVRKNLADLSKSPPPLALSFLRVSETLRVDTLQLYMIFPLLLVKLLEMLDPLDFRPFLVPWSVVFPRIMQFVGMPSQVEGW